MVFGLLLRGLNFVRRALRARLANSSQQIGQNHGHDDKQKNNEALSRRSLNASHLVFRQALPIQLRPGTVKKM